MILGGPAVAIWRDRRTDQYREAHLGGELRGKGLDMLSRTGKASKSYYPDVITGEKV